MSKEFKKNKLEATDINNGMEFTENTSITHADINALVSGVLRNTEELSNNIMNKEDLLNTFANSSDVYLKNEINETFAKTSDVFSKQDINENFAKCSDIYSKNESNERFAKSSDVYVKEISNTLFAAKSDTYSKEDSNKLFAAKNNVYDKESANSIFATKDNVYDKESSDSKFATINNTYDKNTIENTFAKKSDSDSKYAKLNNTYSKSEINNNFVDMYTTQSIYGKKIFEQLNVGPNEISIEELNEQRYLNLSNIFVSFDNFIYFFEYIQSKLYLTKYDKVNDYHKRFILPKNLKDVMPLQIVIDRNTGNVFAMYMQFTLREDGYLTLSLLKRDSNFIESKKLPVDFQSFPFDVNENKLYCIFESKISVINCDTLQPIMNSEKNEYYNFDIEAKPKMMPMILFDNHNNLYALDETNFLHFIDFKNKTKHSTKLDFNASSLIRVDDKIFLISQKSLIYNVVYGLVDFQIIEAKMSFDLQERLKYFRFKNAVVSNKKVYILATELYEDNKVILEFDSSNNTLEIFDEFTTKGYIQFFLFNELHNICYLSISNGEGNQKSYKTIKRVSSINVKREFEKLRAIVGNCITEIPNNISYFNNDSDYITTTQAETVFDQRLSELGGRIAIKGQVDTINELPTTAEIGDIYFVGLTNSEKLFKYLYTIDNTWCLIGELSNQDIDLNSYVKKEEGKGLSECNYTNIEKQKLSRLNENGNRHVIWEGRVREDEIWTSKTFVGVSMNDREDWLFNNVNLNFSDYSIKNKDKIIIHMETNPILTSGEIKPIKDIITIEYTVINSMNMYASEFFEQESIPFQGEEFLVSCIEAECLGGELILNYTRRTFNEESLTSINRYAFANFANLLIYNNYYKLLDTASKALGEDVSDDYTKIYGENNELINISQENLSDIAHYWNYDEAKYITSAVRAFSPINASTNTPTWKNHRPHFGSENLANCYYFTKIEVVES